MAPSNVTLLLRPAGPVSPGASGEGVVLPLSDVPSPGCGPYGFARDLSERCWDETGLGQQRPARLGRSRSRVWWDLSLEATGRRSQVERRAGGRRIRRCRMSLRAVGMSPGSGRHATVTRVLRRIPRKAGEASRKAPIPGRDGRAANRGGRSAPAGWRWRPGSAPRRRCRCEARRYPRADPGR